MTDYGPLRIVRGLAVAGILALATASPAYPQVESLRRQIRESRERLEEIRAEQTRLQQAMRDLSARVHNVSEELENLNRQIQNQEALLRELDHQLAIRDRQVHAATADLLRTGDELEEKKVLFARRARDLYKKGPLARVQILLAAESFADLINRYQYLYLVALHDRFIVRQIEELKNQLERQRQELRRDTRALRELRQEKVAELQDLYHLEQERARRLALYRGRQVQTEQRFEQLVRSEEELTDLIGRLERERRAAEAYAAARGAGTLTPSEAGSLDWPVEGRVVYRFGREQNRDGTVILRRGVGIAAENEAPVRAVQSGTVEFARPYMGYGPSIIVSHGNGYRSLYLYLSDILVAPGENVSAGQIIGRVGGEGTPEGPHLEFQIWQNRSPVDPLDWLKPRD